jgi:hypothetical protein
VLPDAGAGLRACCVSAAADLSEVPEVRDLLAAAAAADQTDGVSEARGAPAACQRRFGNMAGCASRATGR